MMRSSAPGTFACKPERAAAFTVTEFFTKTFVAPSGNRNVAGCTVSAFFESFTAVVAQLRAGGLNIALDASHAAIGAPA